MTLIHSFQRFHQLDCPLIHLPKAKAESLGSLWIEQTRIDNLMSNDAKLLGARGACLTLKGARKAS
jgi:hypothetical protein